MSVVQIGGARIPLLHRFVDVRRLGRQGPIHILAIMENTAQLREVATQRLGLRRHIRVLLESKRAGAEAPALWGRLGPGR